MTCVIALFVRPKSRTIYCQRELSCCCHLCRNTAEILSVQYNDPMTKRLHLHNTKYHYSYSYRHATYRPTCRNFRTIYESRFEPLVAVSPRPAAAEAAANNLLAAPPTRPGSTVGSAAPTNLMVTFRTGAIPDDVPLAGALFLLLVAAAGPLSRRLIVFSFSGARVSLVSSSMVGLRLALGWASESSRSSPASPDVRFDVRRRVVLLAVPVRSGAGAGALVLLGGGGLKTATGCEATGAATGVCKGSGAWTAAGGAGIRCWGCSTTAVFANTGIGLLLRVRGRRAGKETGTGAGTCPGAGA